MNNLLFKSKYLLKKSNEIIMVRGKGIYLYDLIGNKYLDMTSCAWTMNLGYGNNKINNAVCKQIKLLPHCRTHFYTIPKLLLAEKIVNISPIKDGLVDFSLHGSTAIEEAIKLILNYHGGKKEIMVYLKDGFHGRTFGAMSISWKHQNKKFKAFYGKSIEVSKNLKSIEQVFKKYNPAGIFIELIQGNGGTIQLDKELVLGIVELCKKYNVCLVVDEIQTAFGRCGYYFLSDYYNIVPDIITFGKAIGAGIPLFGLLCKNKFNLEPDDHSFTFAHFPLGMVSSLEYLKILDKKLLNMALLKGDYIKQKLIGLKKQFSFLGTIQGMGLMLGIDINNYFSLNRIAIAEYIQKEMLKNKIIIGLSKSVGFGYNLKFKPPIIITYREIDYVIDILKTILLKIRDKKCLN